MIVNCIIQDKKVYQIAYGLILCNGQRLRKKYSGRSRYVLVTVKKILTSICYILGYYISIFIAIVNIKQFFLFNNSYISSHWSRTRHRRARARPGRSRIKRAVGAMCAGFSLLTITTRIITPPFPCYYVHKNIT